MHCAIQEMNLNERASANCKRLATETGLSKPCELCFKQNKHIMAGRMTEWNAAASLRMSCTTSGTRSRVRHAVCIAMQIMQQHKLQLLALLIKGPRNREIEKRIKQSIGNVTDYSKRLMYERCAEQLFCGLLSEVTREHRRARACSAC